MPMRWLRLYLPLGVLVALAVLFTLGLRHDPRTLPSVKLNKLAPEFRLPKLDLATPDNAAAMFGLHDMRGQVWILNVFASWCAACVDEAPSLLRFSKQHTIPLIGLAYKDAPVDTQQWLAKFGNPYQTVAVDQTGNVGIDFGVYGVPETYIIDAKGVIRYRHVGAVDDRFYEQHVLPILEADKQANAKDLTSDANASSASEPLTPASTPVAVAPKVSLTQEEVDIRLKELAAELRCLVCQNQTILDSNAGLAVDLKRQINEQIRAGKTNEEIKAYLLERYGEFVLYNPPKTAKNLPLWWLPLLALLAGFLILLKMLRDNKSKQVEAATAPAATKKQLADIEALYQASQLRNVQGDIAEHTNNQPPKTTKRRKNGHA